MTTDKNIIFSRNAKIKLLFILIVLVFSVCGCNSRPKELKILTFNIRYGTADDGVNSWANRKELVFELLKTEKPDVMGLQEALKFQIDDIIGNLKYYRFFGVGRDDGKEGGEFSPIIYNSRELKIIRGSTFWFSDTPDSAGSVNWGNFIPRICTWAEFELFSSKEKFFIFNLHLDHISQASREKSAALVLRKSKEIAGNYPIIITGDFNAGEKNPAIIKMKERFIDSYFIIHPNEKRVGTFNNFKGIDDNDKIDYIFINRHLKVENAEIIRWNKNGKYPSDHFPVGAVLKIKD